MLVSINLFSNNIYKFFVVVANVILKCFLNFKISIHIQVRVSLTTVIKMVYVYHGSERD